MKKLLLILLCSILYTISAQDWEKLNLPDYSGKIIKEIQEAPNGDLYVLTPQGLFKSTDEALSWTLVSRDASGEFLLAASNKSAFVDDLTLHAINRVNLADGVYSQPLDYSYNLKKEASYGLNFGDTTVFLHISGSNIRNYEYNLLLTTDEGNSFVDRTMTLPAEINRGTKKSLITKGEQEIVFHGSDDKFYRSTDFGVTFTASTSSLELFGNNEPYTIDKVTGDYYAIASIKSGSFKAAFVQKSTDKGNTWTSITNKNAVRGNNIVAHNNMVFVYGESKLHFSNDGGATWEEKSDMLTSVLSPSSSSKVHPSDIMITSKGKVFAIFSSQVYDGTYHHSLAQLDMVGNKVIDRTKGIDYAYCESISYNGSRLAAILSNTAHYSDDFGATWIKILGDGAYSRSTFVAKNNDVYVSKNVQSLNAFIYKMNANDSLVQLKDDQGNTIYGLEDMFEDDKGAIYIATSVDGVYKSTDGLVFTKLANSVSASKTWFGNESKIIYSYSNTGVIRISSDYGVTWTEVTHPGGTIYSLIKGNNKMWLDKWGLDNKAGLYSSIDGANWIGPVSKSENYFDISKEKVFQSDGGTFVAVRSDSRVITSTDGASWSNLKSGIDTVKVFVPYVGVEHKVNPLLLTSSGGKMFLTSNGSIYTREDKDVVDGIFSNVNEDESKIKLYPNPVNDIVYLESDIDIAELNVLSIDGKVVLSGFGEEKLDVSNLLPGVYTISIQTSTGKVITKKIMKK